jgi:predicted RNA binding protein YcfA (HicA-like mRNA interferase family)
MTRLPSLTGKQLIAALGRLGFESIRTRGSHHFLKHSDGRATVVPTHAGETIGPGLLSRILRDCEISREDLQGALR